MLENDETQRLARNAIAEDRMGATRPTAGSPPAPAPEHATVNRVANLVVTILPLALLGVAMWQLWGGALRWPDLVVLAVTYTLTGSASRSGFTGC